MPRCSWATAEPNISYHDEEWGVPVHSDRKLFEFLILEGAQAGLSWITILNKRKNYRKAFDGFRAEKVARYSERDVKRLLNDPGIVRNRLKIAAAIQNAKGVRQLRCLSLEFRRRQTKAKSVASDGSSARAHNRIRRHEPRPLTARIQVCRLNDLLRADAGDRNGERSPCFVSKKQAAPQF